MATFDKKYKKGTVYGYTDDYLKKSALTAAPVVNSTAGTQYRGVKQQGLTNYWNQKTVNDSAQDINTVYPMDVVGIPAKLDKKGVVASGAGTAFGSSGSSGGSGGGDGNAAYRAQLTSLYDQLMGYPSFQYDLTGDMLYRQMADQYTQLGRQASADAQGQAATLTGGYGNSFAQQVGTQAYQQYLTSLNQQIPELYDRAYNTWAGEYDRLLQQYQLAAAHPEYMRALAPRTGGAASAMAATPSTVQLAGAAMNNAQRLLNAAAAGQYTGYSFDDYYERLKELYAKEGL